MTTDFPDLKIRALVAYPANVIGGTGIEVVKGNGSITVDYAWQEFSAVDAIPTSPTSYILTYDTLSGAYVMVPSHLLGGGVAGISDAPNNGILYGRQSVAGTMSWVQIPTGGGTIAVEQHITAAGPVTIQNDTTIVRVNQTVGAPITLNMGLAANKSSPVMIVDWKGDAGTNNITINLSGADKFPGNLTTWKITGNNGSVVLRPIAGVGYAL